MYKSELKTEYKNLVRQGKREEAEKVLDKLRNFDKLYLESKPEAMPGGIKPSSNDDIWVIGFKFELRSFSEYILEGDLNNDFTVDFFDLVKLSSNWLIDCISDPNNPSCPPQ